MTINYDIIDRSTSAIVEDLPLLALRRLKIIKCFIDSSLIIGGDA